LDATLVRAADIGAPAPADASAPGAQAAHGELPKIEASAQPTLFAKSGSQTGHAADALSEYVDMGDAPSCHLCGAIMTRNGSCFRCQSCGSTSGCS